MASEDSPRHSLSSSSSADSLRALELSHGLPSSPRESTRPTRTPTSTMFEFQRELLPLSLSEPVERTREVTAEKTIGLTNGTWQSCVCPRRTFRKLMMRFLTKIQRHCARSWRANRFWHFVSAARIHCRKLFTLYSSSPGVVLADAGSVGASLIVWVVCGLLAWTGARSVGLLSFEKWQRSVKMQPTAHSQSWVLRYL